MSLNKRNICLAKDVIQYVREKVHNQNNCIFDILIASIWLTFHSVDRSQKGCNLKDLLLIDQEIESLTTDGVDERNNTESKTIETRKKSECKTLVSEVDSTCSRQQTDKDAAHCCNDTSKNSDEKSGNTVESLSNSQDKVQKDNENGDKFQNDAGNNSEMESNVQQVVIVKEANKNNFEIETVESDDEDDVIIIEEDTSPLTIDIDDDDFSEKTDKNKESQGKHVIIESKHLPSVKQTEENKSDSLSSKKTTDLCYNKETEQNEETISKCISNREYKGESDLKITNVTGSLILSDRSVIKSTHEGDHCDDIVVIDTDDNEATTAEKTLPQIPVADDEVIAENLTNMAQPVMMMSNIFNSEAQSSQWPAGDLMVSANQNYEICMENVADDNPFVPCGAFDKENSNLCESVPSFASDQIGMSQTELCTRNSILSTSSLNIPNTSQLSCTGYPQLVNIAYFTLSQNSMNFQNLSEGHVTGAIDTGLEQSDTSTGGGKIARFSEATKTKKRTYNVKRIGSLNQKTCGVKGNQSVNQSKMRKVLDKRRTQSSGVTYRKRGRPPKEGGVKAGKKTQLQKGEKMKNLKNLNLKELRINLTSIGNLKKQKKSKQIKIKKSTRHKSVEK